MAPKSSRKSPLVVVALSRGEAFRKASLDGFELTGPELELLAEICNLLNEIDDLQSAVEHDGVTVAGSTGQLRVHPALGELRQHRLALGRLLAQLGLPDPAGDSLPSGVQVRGRTSAKKRWADHG